MGRGRHRQAYAAHSGSSTATHSRDAPPAGLHYKTTQYASACDLSPSRTGRPTAHILAQIILRISISNEPLYVGAAAGAVDVVLSYCHYCLNDTSLEDHLQYLQDKQVGEWGLRY